MGSRTVPIYSKDRKDISKVEAEEQLSFILSVMQASGVPDKELEACITDGQMSVEDKIRFRKVCENFQISIVDDMDGGLKIYVNSGGSDVLVAEWYRPTYTLQTGDSKELTTNLHIHWWTFEEADGKIG